MGTSKRIEEISIMHVLAMIMIIAFHSVCFYGGRWGIVGSIVVPLWENMMRFLDAIDLNMFVFISGYLFGFLHLYKDKYHDKSLILRNKSIRLLIPYGLWGPVYVGCFPFFI